MIVNRLWPGGMPVAMRSMRACIIADESSFCSGVVLMSSEALTG